MPRNTILMKFLETFCEPVYFPGNSTQFSCVIVKWLQKALFIPHQCYYLEALDQTRNHIQTTPRTPCFQQGANCHNWARKFRGYREQLHKVGLGIWSHADYLVVRLDQETRRAAKCEAMIRLMTSDIQLCYKRFHLKALTSLSSPFVIKKKTIAYQHTTVFRACV